MIGTVLVRGTGSIGSRHLRVLGAMAPARLVAYPVRPGRTSSPELGGAEVVDGYPADLDLVVVATDTARHVTDAVEALDRGARLVLVEKPVSSSIAATRLLAQHPRRDRVRVCAPLRFHEGLRAARAAVAALPRPVAARVVSQSWLPDWRPGRDYRDSYSARRGEGGVLLDLVHELDYAAWLLGRPVDVQGVTSGGTDGTPSPVLALDVDEAADLLWRTAEGDTVSVRIDYVTRPAVRGLTVTSAAGSVAWDALGSSVEVRDAEGRTTTTRYAADLDRDEVMARQARAALRLCEGEDDGTLCTLDEALDALHVGERVRPAAVGLEAGR